ncbi:Sec1-like protein [Ochromonadaceae sp. CCMP2298]|nr:Sec1-like protein [Ochromonadaceae sp. CCMP2298]
MEKLAQDLVTSNSVSMISKIYDQYLDVIAIEPNLFTLNITDAFMQYNEPSLSEPQIRAFMGRVASGLLSAVRVMGALPIIRCAPGGAAEMLSRELNSLLRENTSSRGPAQQLFEDCLGDRSRPLLLIADRMADLFPVLQHAATYQALIQDLLDMRLNRVTVELPEKGEKAAAGKGGVKKTYDLNTAADSFLRAYAGSPFPEAVDANEKELAEVSQREASLRSRPDLGAAEALGMSGGGGGGMGGGGGGGGGGVEGQGRDLSEAIGSLPEILQKKANLEAHTNVLQAVMRGVARREVPTYFEIEQGILCNGGRADKGAVTALLRDPSKGLIEDKTRLLLLLAVTGDPLLTAKASAEELDQAFTAGCDSIPAPNTPTPEATAHALAAVAFMRRLQSLSSGMVGAMGGKGGAYGGVSSASSNALLSSFLTSAQSRATSLIAKAASYFTKFTPYLLSRTALNLAEGRACPEDDTFLYLDPRAKDGNGGGYTPGGGRKYPDVVVFVLGGGSYSEYFNLQELLKDKANSGVSIRSITYGCTDMLSGDAFVDQLKRLAKPTPGAGAK